MRLQVHPRRRPAAPGARGKRGARFGLRTAAQRYQRDLDEAAAFLGLRPWEAERLTADQIWDLAQGDRRRFNRQARLAAWFLGLLPSAIAVGVGQGIDQAFGGSPSLEPFPWDELVKDVPDYDPEDE